VELVGVDKLNSLSQPLATADSPDSQVFPSYVVREHAVTKQSALAKLKEQRALKQAQLNGGAS
jgi:hypothetical protein